MRRSDLVFGAASLALALAFFGTETRPVAHDDSPGAEVSDPRVPLTRLVTEASTDVTPAATVADETPSIEAAPYFEDRVLVAVEPDVAEAVAARHGLVVMHVSASLGLARFSVPKGQRAADVMVALTDDPDVDRAFPAGRTMGAGKKKSKKGSVDPADYQWHLKVGEADKLKGDVEHITIAVLDSGVAYEDYSDELGTYVQAPSLATVRVVAPADFVNGDAHANDDHQHGTHIASIILSDGDVEGVAPGATLMPVKVLDETNQGDELALIEGLYHAVDHGAQVINMSLSFGAAFVPSSDLVRALTYAEKSGVVLVAASGNAGHDRVSWPAASPSVIGVGAMTMKDDNDRPLVPDYSNLGAVDLLAPGGEPGVDRNEDGYQDGVLAETFAPGHPAELGYFFQSGTSQAAAFISGAAAQLLAEGAAPDEVRGALQQGASSNHLGTQAFVSGTGAGMVNVDEAVDLVKKQRVSTTGHRFVSLMPYLEAQGSEVMPWVEFTVVDAEGEPVAGARVTAFASGTTTARRFCTTSSDGTCRAMAPRYHGAWDDPVAWVWEVETVSHNEVAAPLGSVMFADLPFEVLVASLEEHDELDDDALIAVHWPSGEQEDLGRLAESYTVANYGTGLLTSPLGLVFTPRALGNHQRRTHQVSLEGSGLLTSPLGLVEVHELSLFLDNAGFLQSRLGEVSLVAADGSGLLTSPLGFHPRALFQARDAEVSWGGLEGSGLLTSPLGFRSSPIFLSEWEPFSSGLAGTAVGDRLEAGGWTTETGVPGVTSLLGAGLIQADAPDTVDFSDQGTRLMP